MLGHHCFQKLQWLYITAFFGSGAEDTDRYLPNSVSNLPFSDLLEGFAKAIVAGSTKHVMMLLDDAGSHIRTSSCLTASG